MMLLVAYKELEPKQRCRKSGVPVEEKLSSGWFEQFAGCIKLITSFTSPQFSYLGRRHNNLSPCVY